MKIGDIVHVVEDGVEHIAPGIVTKIEDGLVSVAKFANGATTFLEGIKLVDDEAAARVEGAGEHAAHVAFPRESAPAVDVDATADASPVGGDDDPQPPAAPAAAPVPVATAA